MRYDVFHGSGNLHDSVDCLRDSSDKEEMMELREFVEKYIEMLKVRA